MICNVFGGTLNLAQLNDQLCEHKRRCRSHVAIFGVSSYRRCLFVVVLLSYGFTDGTVRYQFTLYVIHQINKFS